MQEQVDALGVQFAEEVQQVDQRPSQAIDRPGRDHVDVAPEPTLRTHVSVERDGECQMSDTVPGVPITHPEEMLGSFDVRIGKNINLKGSGRITPAGIVTAGLMTVAVLVAATALVRAARR
jgi:hypothetical protein